MRAFLLICVFTTFYGRATAQQTPDWAQVTPKIFDLLEQETLDSINGCRARAALIRSEMEQIIQKRGDTRVYIFGPDDAFFKEGMHKQFTAPPTPVQALYDRDPQMVRLENLHVGLFQVDQSLFRWMDIKERLKGYEERETTYKWESRFQNLLPELRTNLNQNASWALWGTNELACMIVQDMGGFSETNPRGKVSPLSMEKNIIGQGKIPIPAKPRTFPMPADELLASFPMNGQYAFCRSESIPGVGYIFFPPGSTPVLHEIVALYPVVKARWTSSEGMVIYTDALFKLFENEAWFTLPDFYFKPATLYKMELVVLKKAPENDTDLSDLCWSKLRQSTGTSITTIDKQTEFRIITSLFFRTSRYENVRDRFNTMKGDIDWEAGSIRFETDEPMDPLEMNGSRYFPAPVSFLYDTDKLYITDEHLNNPALIYYLAVPQTGKQGDSTSLAITLSDHTADALFVRKTAAAKHDGYASLENVQVKRLLQKNGYSIPLTNKRLLKDSLITSQKVPLITQKDFEKGKIKALGQVKCELIIGEMAAASHAMRVYKTQLERRIDQRAQFFWELDSRKAVRMGVPFNKSVSEYRQEELVNLPASAQFILQNEIKNTVKTNCTIYCTRSWPGAKQATAQLSLKL